MEVILPEPHNEQKFLRCASQLQYDEFNAKMLMFYTGCSDVDVYQLMAEDRLLQLIYGWEVCKLHNRDCITEEASYIVKVLAHHTLQLWFSQEWISCTESLKRMVLYYLTKGYSAFNRIEGLCDIDWQYILNFQTSPWRVPYLQKIFSNLKQNKHSIIEHAVAPATSEDVDFLKQERLHLIILRLLKLFDAGSWEAVKQLSLRVLAAWLKFNAGSEGLQNEKMSIVLVGHLYLLTVFVADDNRGYAIDNMMYNIRFYVQSMQTANAEDLSYTPARLIAQVCVRLGLGKDGFFEYIVFKKFKLSLVTPFAVMLEAYTSYVLGNQLLELMALNDHDFMKHFDHFKVLMKRYIEERENSERFLSNELQKLEAQRFSHALPNTVNLNLNYQQQICKGNRASNIGNYKNCDDDEKPPLDVDEELDRQIDPVFQNVPNNEIVLEVVYEMLAERPFRGWQFAKIALLLKIIGQQLNTIEVWRYHPGLTTEFMLSLELKLSDNYADLAKVFSEHNFMEAEFWLTAFYLNPTAANFIEVKRCSRFKKKRKEEDENNANRTAARAEKSDHIKYELLSSTIDVDEIVAITNHNSPIGDYDPICKALQALRLPRSILKDLLTVAFQPRNKRYSWALEWTNLYERCSALVKTTDLKRKFVALNMAEANDRLKFLKIDYDKYKNRPQLDYGTIEEGYENAANSAEGDQSTEEDEDAQREARELAEKERKRKRNSARKFWKEIISEDEEEEEPVSDESEAYYTGTGRRTRVRAAAIVANAMFSDMDRSTRSGRRSPVASNSTAEGVEQPTITEAPQTSSATDSSKRLPEKPSSKIRSFGELLGAQAKYTNETCGFKSFTDIWSYEKNDVLSVKNDDKVLLESNTLMSKFRNLQGLKQSRKAAAEGVTLKPMDTEKEPSELDSPHSSDSCDSDEDSLHSGTSTMALHDSNEFEDDNFGVSKELTPQPASSSDITVETEKLQLDMEILTAAATVSASDAVAVPLEEERITGTQTASTSAVAMETGALQREKDILTAATTVSTADVDAMPLGEETTTGTQTAATSNITVETKKLQLDKEIVTAATTVPAADVDAVPSVKMETQPPRLYKPLTRNLRLEGLAQQSMCEEVETKDITKMDLEGPDWRIRLVKECLNRPVQVRLQRLTTQDIEKLRGVRVRLKRTNMHPYYQDKTVTVKAEKDSTSSRNQSDENNTSTPTSDIEKGTKPFVHITSDTPAASSRLMDDTTRIKQFKRFKHITSDSSNSTDIERKARPASKRRRRGQKLTKRKQVTKPKTEHITGDSDIIELSSDTLSSSMSPNPVPAPGSVNHFPQVFMPLGLDPLYEEEIVPF